MTSLSTARALLVDDQALVRTAIRTMLGFLGVQNIHEASSGEDAIAMLLEHPIDFVISDIDMSPQNGMEFLRNIRCGNYGMRRDTRLIMLTGLTAPEVAKACINLDVNAFLTKPAKREMLAERLDFALNMPMTVQPVEYYQQQELPPLTRSQPMASRPTQSTQPVSSASARKVESTAPTVPAAASTDSSSTEHGMAYVIWHERFQTGIEAADVIIKEASLKLNETYRARGNGATVQSVGRRVEDWSNFANNRLTAFEAFLAPHHPEGNLLLLARLRREMLSKLSQLRLLLQAAPDVASYELFDAVRHWWSSAYNTWRSKE